MLARRGGARPLPLRGLLRLRRGRRLCRASLAALRLPGRFGCRRSRGCSGSCLQGGQPRLDRRDQPEHPVAAGRGRTRASARRIDSLLDPLTDQVARPHVGLGGQLLERPDAARVETNRHRTLVEVAVRPRTARRIGRPIPSRPVALVIATPTLTAPRRAAGARRAIVGSVGTAIGAAVGTASVETHRFQRYFKRQTRACGGFNWRAGVLEGARAASTATAATAAEPAATAR